MRSMARIILLCWRTSRRLDSCAARVFFQVLLRCRESVFILVLLRLVLLPLHLVSGAPSKRWWAGSQFLKKGNRIGNAVLLSQPLRYSPCNPARDGIKLEPIPIMLKWEGARHMKKRPAAMLLAAVMIAGLLSLAACGGVNAASMHLRRT